MDALNHNWEFVSLEYLLTYVIGGDWGKDENFDNSDFKIVSCIRGSEFKNWKKELGATAVTRSIKSASLENRRLAVGDLLIEISGGGPDQPVGRTVVITDEVLKKLPHPVICTNFLRLARPTKLINSNFLNYYLVSFYNSGEVINYQGGSNNLRNLKFKEYLKVNMPLPSIAEQKIIADKLDIMLSQVENIKTRLENIPNILKTFRQSVLAAAVSGKLTEEWRNKNKITWPENKSKLGDLIVLAYGKSLPAKIRSGNGFPVFGSNGVVGLHDESLVEGPFIVVGRKGSYGEITWSESSGWPIDTTYFVDLKENANLRFVFFLLQTLGLNQLNRSTAIPGLNREDAYIQAITIPELQEQIEIVSIIEKLLSRANSIEQKTKSALERVNNLTQSILAKAFCGALTEQWRAENPDLISGENSAEALLEKIKAEREVLKVSKKSSKKETP